MESAGRGQTPVSAHHSFRTAASRYAGKTGEAAESPPIIVEDKIFVAVPEEFKHGKSTLLWALQNLAMDSSRSRIVIAHVHTPAEMITMGLGANVHYSTMRPQELHAYRQHEREKMEKRLNEYVLICRRLKVNCDKEDIQNDDIAKGIIELIALHGITKLVVGAASDKNYSKEAKEEVPAVPSSSPAATNTAPPPEFNISSQMRSMMIQQLENEASSSNVSTMNDSRRSRRDVPCSPSEGTGVTVLQPLQDVESTFNGNQRRPWRSEDFSVHSDRSQNSGCCSPAAVGNDDISEVGSNMHLSTDDSHDRISPTPHALTKEQEKSYVHELQQWKALKEMHERQRQENDVMRRQQEEAYAALHDANEQKVTLEHQISEIEQYVKDNEDKLATNKHQLEVLRADYDRLQHERDAAIREAAKLRENSQQGVLAPSEALNTKFSLTELQQATQDFDPTLKIGEGGFGSVYKGFLRNTTVAIKLLHPQSMQGQSEFHQEARKQPQRIAEIVEEAIEQGNLHSIIDNSAGSWPFVQANQLANIALRCAELSRRRRPDLTVDVWKGVEPLMKAASMTARPLPVTNPSYDTCIPSYFICPILQEIMNDPYIAADGFTYEGEAIKGWLDSGHSTSPMTNLKLEHTLLVPNRALRSAILEWQQQEQQH
ncbi:unnamed protein product [Urochloa decumbens]|uniref:RING-type E3 ubiquitin transferase n=1 Tax=Urochloa decumbens TaxID=240449 RepID=A0ABC9C680_9POAL